ncbi:MAG: hypothetical protein EBT07_08865 [Actinobacteria bacterium]|nr:hypothetical protein [Actinomycetota bacterium]
MRRSAIYFGAGLLLFLLVWVVFRQSQKQEMVLQSKDPKSQTSKPGTASPPQDSPKDLSKEEDKIVLHAPNPALKVELQVLKSRLAQKPDREKVLRLLREFMQKAFASNPDAAAAALLEFLRTGEDLSTSLGFVVGEAGLDEWPTLRAFLLDLLGKIDPEMASRYALDTVIPAKSSTVEYAVSLQILWNHGGAEKPTPELTQAWLGLLKKADWSARPDPAWLESLDFASRIPEATPEFLKASTDWLADPENVVERVGAVDLALERMAVQQPVETMEELVRDPSLLSLGRGIYQRSQIFARASLNDSNQQKLLAAYLQRLDPGSQEAELFFSAFPCHNFSVSPGLSGQPKVNSSREIIASDRAALQWWQTQSSALWASKHQGEWVKVLTKIRKITENQ